MTVHVAGEKRPRLRGAGITVPRTECLAYERRPRYDDRTVSVRWIEWTGIAVSIASAGLAGWQARKARLSEQEAERLRFAEERVSEHKYEIYKPMLTMFGRMLRGVPFPDGWEQDLDDFNTWLLMFGSDDAISSWGQLMQATYAHAPAEIIVRMYVQFMLAARRDMGDPGTRLGNLDALAPRISDLYENRGYYAAVALPLERLYNKHNWMPPWERRFEDMVDDESAAIEPAGGTADPETSHPSDQ